MEEKSLNQVNVVMAGLGGQGLLTMGKLLCEAGALHYKHVVYFPLYSADMRGGECECMVTFSEEKNTAYGTLNPSAAIIMSSKALKDFETRVCPGGLIILDSFTIAEKVSRDDVQVFYIPATKIALDIGDRRVANLVLLGAYLEVTKVLPVELVVKTLGKRLGETRGAKLLSLNKEALNRGAKLVASYDDEGFEN